MTVMISGWPAKYAMAFIAAQLPSFRATILSAAADADGAEGRLLDATKHLSDKFLIKCLWQHKGDVDKASVVALNFLRFRSSSGWEFEISPTRVDPHALRCGMHWLLRDRLGRAVMIFNPHYLDRSKCSVEKYQHMGMYLMEQATNCPEVQRRGAVLVFDCRQMPLSLLYQFNLEDVQRGTNMWQGAFPCRVRRVCILGLSHAAAGVVTSSLYVCLSRKMRSRVTVVPTTQVLATMLGEECLPDSLGGQRDNFNWQEVVDQHLAHGKPLI